MPDNKKAPAEPVAKKVRLIEGYQPSQRGYKPGTSNLNPAKPPQGGTGVPPKKPAKK